jgi:hypothetical protein
MKSVRTTNETNFTPTKINLFTQFKELITVYTENHKELNNKKCRINERDPAATKFHVRHLGTNVF